MRQPSPWPLRERTERGLTLGRVNVADRVIGVRRMSGLSRAATFGLAETLFTTRDGPPPRDRLDWLCGELEHFFAHSSTRARLLYGLCLTAISLVAPWYARRALPLWLLDADTRTVALERFEQSAFGLSLFGAKAILCILYYEHPDAAAAIGYDAECLVDGEPDIPT